MSPAPGPNKARLTVVGTLRTRLTAEAVDAAAKIVRAEDQAPALFKAEMLEHAEAGETWAVIGMAAAVFASAAIDQAGMHPVTRLNLAAFAIATADVADAAARKAEGG